MSVFTLENNAKKTYMFLSDFHLFSSRSKFLLVFTFKTFCNQSMYKEQVNTREVLIRRIRNTAAKKGMKQFGEQQAPFVDEVENVKRSTFNKRTHLLKQC
jgi:hypothetical protein